MVNVEDFIKRLEIILDYYSLTASSFADKINVQRSSLSHLLSGRNKPSLDFIMKIIEVFPEVDLYWILNGEGSFPKSNEEKRQQPQHAPALPLEEDKNLFSIPEEIPLKMNKEDFGQETLFKSANLTAIEKIVILYKDGTFSEYKPR